MYSAMTATYPGSVDYVIVVAAGSGARLGADRPKALVEIAGAPLVTWSLRASRGPVVGYRAS